jgi:hypothetical protein
MDPTNLNPDPQHWKKGIGQLISEFKTHSGTLSIFQNIIRAGLRDVDEN